MDNYWGDRFGSRASPGLAVKDRLDALSGGNLSMLRPCMGTQMGC